MKKYIFIFNFLLFFSFSCFAFYPPSQWYSQNSSTQYAYELYENYVYENLSSDQQRKTLSGNQNPMNQTPVIHRDYYARNVYYQDPQSNPYGQRNPNARYNNQIAQRNSSDWTRENSNYYSEENSPRSNSRWYKDANARKAYLRGDRDYRRNPEQRE